ncbi:OLC1v1026259C1 [Oldenlandia corymbosa var. corymbosa]|uniref:OLC1v1026259C1 n=1 Tax=Oldenlandia corymbosa var. corymbosa TaxID=529605 RepID=A0AAV1C7A8_OLDCO|nr:OLC1v1026259C1 [Oldenlandia corymbosa var. corymbosa]
MGSLEKLFEVSRLFEEKQGVLLERADKVMVEYKAAEDHFKMVEDHCRLCYAELKSKEKDLRSIQKSVKQSYAELDLKKRYVEEGLMRLDQKEKYLKGVLRKIEDGEMEFGHMRVAFDELMGVVVGKEKELENLFEALKIMQNLVVKRKLELDSKEKLFLRQVEKREKELDSKEKLIQSQVEEKGKELDLKEKILEIREAEIHLMMERKRNEIDAEENRLARRSNELDSKEKYLLGREKEMEKQLEEKVGVLESNNLEDAVSQTHSGEVMKPGREVACLLDEEMKMEDISSKLAIIQVDDLRKSVAIVAEKGKLAGNIGAGEIWACFKSFNTTDSLPRSYAKVIKVIDNGGQVWVEVDWLEPSPVQRGQEEWIEAGLPVTCGKFDPGRRSVISPTLFSHPMLCARYDPCIIIPGEGETWVFYKNWDIGTWSTNPGLHRHCEYEVVEILPYYKDASSSPGVKVAYLEKIRGSLKSFKRRSESYNDSLLIDIENLYSFSHKVPSTKRIYIDEEGTLCCEFDLDPKCLPLELQ